MTVFHHRASTFLFPLNASLSNKTFCCHCSHPTSKDPLYCSLLSGDCSKISGKHSLSAIHFFMKHNYTARTRPCLAAPDNLLSSTLFCILVLLLGARPAPSLCEQDTVCSTQNKSIPISNLCF